MDQSLKLTLQKTPHNSEDALWTSLITLVNTVDTYGLATQNALWNKCCPILHLGAVESKKVDS